MEEAISGEAWSVYREMAEEDNHRIELHRDDLIGSEDDDDDDEVEGMERLKLTDAPEGGAPNPRPYPRLRKKGNTGPKGVLADYAEAKERQRLKREAEVLSFNLHMRDKAVSYNRAETVRMESEQAKDDDEDDEFLKEYRAKRLRELQGKEQPKHKMFGYLRRISRDQYPDEIDEEKDSDIPVVIHLYKDVFPACVKLNYCLQQLAIKYPTIKFLKIISTEAKDDFDDVALPTVIIYRGGEVFKSFVKITEDLGSSEFDQDDIEELLIRANVIGGADKSFASKGAPTYDY